MTTNEVAVLKERVEQMLCDVREIKSLVREQNGRVKTLELWQASMRGAGHALRVGWLVAGGVLGALAFDVIRGWMG